MQREETRAVPSEGAKDRAGREDGEVKTEVAGATVVEEKGVEMWVVGNVDSKEVRKVKEVGKVDVKEVGEVGEVEGKGTLSYEHTIRIPDHD